MSNLSAFPNSSNESYHPYPGANNGPAALVITKIILIALSSIVTVIGNVIIVLIVARNKKMWNSTNYYIVNLAISDLFVALFVEWTYLVSHLVDSWPFGRFLCTFCSTLQGLTVICSILTLTVIAGDRFFAIIFPLMWRETKARTCVIAILIVWAVSISINIPLIIVIDYEEYTWDDGIYQIICWEHWPSEEAKNKYTIALFVFTYILPFLIMLFAYGSIGRRLWTKKGPSAKRKDSGANSKDRAKRKMLVAVVSAFAFCWLPYQVYMVVNELLTQEQKIDLSIRKHIAFFTLWIGYANSAMNPIIYCGFNDNFRKGFAEMFTFSWCPKWLTGNNAANDKVHRGPSSFANPTGSTKGTKPKSANEANRQTETEMLAKNGSKASTVNEHNLEEIRLGQADKLLAEDATKKDRKNETELTRNTNLYEEIPESIV
ncbi:QRFP-like peptide receptor isoform X2 [Ptychodera flava]|uniref:QRFP-like peptide receptor isoform X2 n=1 Tax=Ptychodera flava TaxID=63121 RepID=UPI003969F377